VGEGRRRLESALVAEPETTEVRARALNGATAMAVESGDAATARQRAEEALDINRELGDDFGVAPAEFLLANVAAAEHDEYYSLLSTRVLAWVCAELGDTDYARALHEENLRLAREVGNKRIE